MNPRLVHALLPVALLPALLVATDGSAVSLGGAPLRPDSALLARAQSGDAAAGATLFAADLLAALGRADHGNLVASPLSVYDVLALLVPGARGDTAKALDRALHSTLSAPDLLLDTARLRQELGGDGTLRVATAAWLQDGYPVRPDYAQILTDAGAPPRSADFVRASEAARRAINAWIEQNTAGRIRDMVPAGAVNGLTRLVLADAIALDAQWERPFEKPLTKPQAFHTPLGDRSVQMMHQTRSLSYAAGAGWQAVRLPYKGGRLDALVVLPDPGVDPLAVLGSVTAPPVRDAFSDTLVALGLPRFDLAGSFDLHNALTDLGLGQLYDGPDLSGIGGRPGDLDVSGALHRALLSVDESGTKGAAATALFVSATAFRGHRSQPLDLTFDRPFLFVVEDSQHGVPVFVARVSDPSAAG